MYCGMGRLLALGPARVAGITLTTIGDRSDRHAGRIYPHAFAPGKRSTASSRAARTQGFGGGAGGAGGGAGARRERAAAAAAGRAARAAARCREGSARRPRRRRRPPRARRRARRSPGGGGGWAPVPRMMPAERNDGRLRPTRRPWVTCFAMTMETAEAFEPRPLLRGVFHQWAFVASLVAGAVLVVMAPSGRAAAVGGVYAAALAGMFGASALYHRVAWPPWLRPWMRRLDHSMIFVLIAG